MRNRSESQTGTRQKTNQRTVLIGVAGALGLLIALGGCQAVLVALAQDITGIPLAGIPTPTQIPTPATPVAPTPTPAPVSVKISTSMGDIVVQLNLAAPITVKNFLQYVDAGFYSNLIFHRSVQGGAGTIFIVQGGGFYATGQQPVTNPPIALEDNTGLKNVRGTIAMARTSIADSATSQFFFNNQDNPSLDPTATTRGYAVFGTITAGLSVMDAMAALPILDDSAVNPAFNTKPCPGGDLNSSVVILSITRQ